MFTLAAQLTWLRSKNPLNAGLFLSGVIEFSYVFIDFLELDESQLWVS